MEALQNDLIEFTKEDETITIQEFQKAFNTFRIIGGKCDGYSNRSLEALESLSNFIRKILLGNNLLKCNIVFKERLYKGLQ